MLKRSVFTLLLLFSAGMAVAQDTPSHDFAHQIYKASSLSRFIQQVSGDVGDLVESASAELNAEDTARLAHILTAAFDATALENDVFASMYRNMDQDAAPRVINWLQEPLTISMQAMESQPEPPDGALEAFAETLDTGDPAVLDRINVFQSYISETRMAEEMVNMLSTMMMAMMRAGEALGPPAEMTSENELLMQAEALKAQLLPQYEPAVLILMMYYFREASTTDVQQYAAFYATKDGAWYNDLTSTAITDAFEGAANRMSAELGLMVD